MILGKKHWVIAGGHIPPDTTGREPMFTSHDRFRLLNVSDDPAHVEITIFYRDRPEVGPYRISLGARRVRTVRVNDLIDPLPVPLDTDYGAVIESDVPIVVQFTRLDSGARNRALLGAMAFPCDD